MLYSDNRLLPGLSIIDETLDAVIKAEVGANVELFNEFLDLERARGGDYRDQLVDFLRKKYAGTKVDVIVAVREPALKFAVARRSEMFPGAIVHVALTVGDLAGKELPRDVAGVPIKLMPEKTIELALELHPGIKRVVVITGSSGFDKAWESLLRNAFRPLESRVSVEFWSGLPMSDILSRVSQLPHDTIAYLPGMRQDGTGQRFVPQLVAADVVTASSVPVYGNASNFREVGTIGGYIAPLDEVARQAAQLTVRLLRGEKPETLSPPAEVQNAYILNMVQLRRFGVDESKLPPGAILKYRQPTLWEAYRWQIGALIVLLLLQAALIAALLVQRRIRRLAQATLRESEQRMNLAAEATGVGMWLQDLSRHEFWASPQHRALLGMKDGERYDFERFLAARHAEDRAHVSEAIEGALTGGGKYDVSYRVPLPDGRVRWVDSRGRVEVDARGRAVRIRGVTSDVTARKEAELEAQRHRNELAHVSRVGMLGQLSGSLAHELNQPLTAILSNAQAALRFLNMESADLDEVRDILKDIVADDKRAGDVIRRLRALYERGEAKYCNCCAATWSAATWPSRPISIPVCPPCSATACSCSSFC